MANPIVFFDITIGGEPVGRMEIELYADMCPITAENFRALCTGEKGKGRSGPLHYKGSSIYGVDSRGFIMGGAIIEGETFRGESIYGANFKNENSLKAQDRPGTLSMNTQVGTGNSSMFIISTKDCPFFQLSVYDHIRVFGQVLTGLSVLDAIASTTTTSTKSSSSKPTKPVIIADCGQIIKNIETEVFFDIAIGGTPTGRIIMKLFYDTAPLAAANFRSLCIGDKAIGNKSGQHLHYKGSIFHRIIPGVMCHGGDFALNDGSEGESIQGADKFLAENFEKKHTGLGFLSMVNSGKGADGSQFYICTTKTDWLDGKHVVFGQVVQGMDVVNAMDNVGLPDGMTTATVTIVDCGQIIFDYPGETGAVDDDEYIEPY